MTEKGLVNPDWCEPSPANSSIKAWIEELVNRTPKEVTPSTMPNCIGFSSSKPYRRMKMLLNWNNDEFSLEQAEKEIFEYYKDEYENFVEGSLFKLLKGKKGYTIQ